MEPVVNHQAQAASRLYRVLAEAAGDDNVFLSPFSIATALSMAFGGAGGDTALQLRQALALPEDAASLHDGYGKVLAKLNDPPNVTLSTANKMYVQNSYKILDSYLELMKNQYLSELKSVDFADAAGTSKLINDDVESLTRGKIKDLIDPSALNALVRLVLVNAIYFKGSWQEKFDKEVTQKQDFFVTPDSAVKTDMMFMDGKRFNCGVLSDLGCKALELPYEGRRFSMLLLLPDKKDGLKALEEKLANTPVQWRSQGGTPPKQNPGCATAPVQSIMQKLHSEKTTISIPKFKLETSYNLEDHLKKLGIVDLFDFNSADLSKISGNNDLFVSKVVHKAFIEVNEEGTEAAAATGMVMQLMCFVPNFEFFANHPFFFAIVDNEVGLVLFSGRYVKPE
ncbi:leukocyte elastase inhibitor-like [Amphibalanus amphitrite]|uniref:leukocyte elastase inhibitor-like n=1 Tax=Amphibalanus amphitrite TaxID=1232801 RepID=UPI001C919743|nr:leukocyte elastase inhibitor-like [Amphibalanus amphitrite]